MNTDRVTRSRARTQAASGETPSLAALPTKTPSGTARTTRRQAAAAAATAPPASSSGSTHADDQAVAPVVLFNQVDSPPAATRPDKQVSSDEPPATPSQSVPASPAPLVPGATPTGLGLSGLLPLSPLAAMPLHSKTPAVTPSGGAVEQHGKVSSALHAAAQALGGSHAAADAAAGLPLQQQQQQVPAAAKEEQSEELLFTGFGSPLKQEAAESPAATAVSIGDAIIPAAVAAEASSEACSSFTHEPAAVADDGGEREMTLEDMLGTPWPLGREASPEEASPTFQPSAAACLPSAVAVPVRTVQSAHPLTPSRQVVLEEEEQDYVMAIEEQAEVAAAQACTASPVAQRVDEVAVTADVAAPVAAKPRLASKVVVPSPGVFDPRSLRQLKKQVADRMAAKQAGVLQAADYDYEEEEGEDDDEYIGTSAVGDELAEELGTLTLGAGTHGPLRGVPTPVGSHIRFGEDDDEVVAVSPRQKLFLRGMPEPVGNHIRFD